VVDGESVDSPKPDEKVVGSFVADSDPSFVASKVGFALGPVVGVCVGSAVGLFDGELVVGAAVICVGVEDGAGMDGAAVGIQAQFEQRHTELKRENDSQT